MNPIMMAVIMMILSFILGYFINESISLKKNITANTHKLYMVIFMSLQMGIIELILHPLDQSWGYLLVLLVFSLYFGYQLYTLNFLTDEQFLLSMIEHHENAVVMSEQILTKTKNTKLQQFSRNIISTQQREIDDMYEMLKVYN